MLDVSPPATAQIQLSKWIMNLDFSRKARAADLF